MVARGGASKASETPGTQRETESSPGGATETLREKVSVAPPGLRVVGHRFQGLRLTFGLRFTPGYHPSPLRGSRQATSGLPSFHSHSHYEIFQSPRRGRASCLFASGWLNTAAFGSQPSFSPVRSAMVLMWQ